MLKVILPTLQVLPPNQSLSPEPFFDLQTSLLSSLTSLLLSQVSPYFKARGSTLSVLPVDS